MCISVGVLAVTCRMIMQARVGGRRVRQVWHRGACKRLGLAGAVDARIVVSLQVAVVVVEQIQMDLLLMVKENTEEQMVMVMEQYEHH